jgi:hypothetical protein
MKMRKSKPLDDVRIDEAIHLLRKVRELLRAVDAPKTIVKVRLAIKSAEGARRHVYRRQIHTEAA